MFIEERTPDSFKEMYVIAEQYLKAHRKFRFDTGGCPIKARANAVMLEDQIERTKTDLWGHQITSMQSKYT